MVKLQKRKRGKKDGVTVCPAIGSEEVPWVRNDEELMLAQVGGIRRLVASDGR